MRKVKNMREEIEKRLKVFYDQHGLFSDFYIEELASDCYRLSFYSYYNSIICFGTCYPINIKTAEDLDSYFVGWKDREEVLLTLKLNNISVFSDVAMRKLRKKENYWEIEYDHFRKGSEAEKLINKLHELGLWGKNRFSGLEYFKLPVEGYKEFIELLV